jgi:hypothetical protein
LQRHALAISGRFLEKPRVAITGEFAWRRLVFNERRRGVPKVDRAAVAFGVLEVGRSSAPSCDLPQARRGKRAGMSVTLREAG